MEFVYDQSKAAGELEIHAAVEAGLNATILNPTGILGPHDYCSSLGGQMLRKLFTGKMSALINAGFDWVDVRDVADAIRTSIADGRTGEQYLLSGKWISFRELAALCEAAFGVPCPRMMLPLWIARLGLPVLQMQSWLTGADPLYTYETLAILRDSNQNCSAKKARRDLGFASRPLSETVSETFEWSRSHGFI